ncbi:MAG: hypothetical protein ACO1N2_03610 [Candidatus Saccharimonadota bacterium]
MRINSNQTVPRGLKPLQRSFFGMLGQEKPKPIPPKLVRIYGYPLSAMISQLLFWKGMEMRKDGYIYKTERDFINELGLSSAQQKLAIKKGKDFGFLKVVRKGVPAKRHYLLNYDRLVESTVLEAERKHITIIKRPFKTNENSQTTIGDSHQTITYSTKEITTRKHRPESAADILSKRYGKY